MIPPFLPPSQIIVTADERDRVLLNPMVVLAREHLRRCGFNEEEVGQSSPMRTAGTIGSMGTTGLADAADAKSRTHVAHASDAFNQNDPSFRAWRSVRPV